MGKRRKARILALKILYIYEINEFSNLDNIIDEVFRIEENLTDDVKDYSLNLIKKVTLFFNKLNEIIDSVTKNWSIQRMAIIDKNILRIALVEIFFQDNVPDIVAIDEAIEIAKLYSTSDSGGFVNGILDKILKNKEKYLSEFK
ncbi:MAG: transcription antitermination factor NusB [bacterium]|uniref:Transcription antitermination protein NusB n=1 Tax=candidate division TA06 bacterium 34_109 TaxID=1635277 RepID=A0A117M6N3_UNCT6|nr:MAG: N utilization substance protein B-like protein [candidate division TA06 bacterium 32_111]KUK87252.1 MAG: N utilization substance protein B-like protein [candidate division TA06 bacterium 34_109]MDI6700490.1 transcription antitermination factor NusB [bacterium]